ncbi:glycosyl transferase family 41-domain-containing protein [Syncephalis fuscata]|nr:glycosyl transferase family 41-domain-containing protein [Syncephalis fuscata]
MMAQQPINSLVQNHIQAGTYNEVVSLVSGLQQQQQQSTYSLYPSASAVVIAAAAAAAAAAGGGVGGNNPSAIRYSLPAMMIPPPSPNIYPFLAVADDKWRRDSTWGGVASPRQQYYDPVRPHADLTHMGRRAPNADYSRLMREYGRPVEEIMAAAATGQLPQDPQARQLLAVAAAAVAANTHHGPLSPTQTLTPTHPQQQQQHHHHHHHPQQQHLHSHQTQSSHHALGLPSASLAAAVAAAQHQQQQRHQRHPHPLSQVHYQHTPTLANPSSTTRQRVAIRQQQQQQQQQQHQLLAAAAAATPPNSALLPLNANSSLVTSIAGISALPSDLAYQDIHSEALRDRLLAQAHSMYATKPRDNSLLPLLSLIHTHHPDHLPTMLLMACVYFAHQHYQMSLHYNVEILKRDSQYVEAMSNIGTTLRGMGRHTEAEAWWWRAIQLRPNYWDAVDNLVGVLCSVGPEGKADPVRYREALKVCDFVGANVIAIPRLQNVLHVSANLHYQLGALDAARREYERVLRVMFNGITVESIIMRIAQTFGQSSGNLLLLLPEQAVNLASILFPATDGILPTNGPVNGASHELSTAQQQQSNQVTATILLTLAKWHQDTTSCPPAALSLVLPLYYFSLSLHRSPSTCNNLGILLSSIQQSVPDPTSGTPLNGPQLAMRYYTCGQLEQAIQMYERAVQFNPKFDVALANLANAVKDAGRVQDSIQWYRSAVEVNPDFSEAVCGLVNALGGVCDWRGRGGVAAGWTSERGWMEKVIEIVDKQLADSRGWANGVLTNTEDGRKFVKEIQLAWLGFSSVAFNEREMDIKQLIPKWLNPNELMQLRNQGGWVFRALDKCLRRIQHYWYIDQHSNNMNPTCSKSHRYRRQLIGSIKRQRPMTADDYRRPRLPLMAPPPVPTVLPFHTFTYPLSSLQIRLISHRNALRISHNTLSASWLPSSVYPPPPPPAPKLRIGYVSSDFNNHPLAHLMQSVFGFHDRSQCVVLCYATTPADGSPYRTKIERESDTFLDVSTWTTQAIVERIVADGIHVLINLNGYTKGARNEIFAARPCPVQLAYMGFAGTLAAGWCDYFIVDPIVCPPETVAWERWRARLSNGLPIEQLHDNGDCGQDIDPEDETEPDWVYSERLIYMPHSYFVNDHRQGFREEDEDVNADAETKWSHEEDRRWRMRRQVFPGLRDDVVVFANFNQLYKIDPCIFRAWLRILASVPNSILWLLRFPVAGEQHILNTAEEWAGKEIASRIVFTDVAAKQIHIHRGRVADLFLDTPECNGHTTSTDILWSGTPVLTLPRHYHKMCSRVAASIAFATGYGDDMVVDTEEAYIARAIEYARTLYWDYSSDPMPPSSFASTVIAANNSNSNTSLIANMPSSNARLPPTLLDQGHSPLPRAGLHRRGHGPLMELRKKLFLTRDVSPLFDTGRWVRNLEKGYWEAWRRWASGDEFTIDDNFDKNENNDSSITIEQLMTKTGCILIMDDTDGAASSHSNYATSQPRIDSNSNTMMTTTTSTTPATSNSILNQDIHHSHDSHMDNIMTITNMATLPCSDTSLSQKRRSIHTTSPRPSAAAALS